MDNVITFPKKERTVDHFPSTIDEVEDSLEAVRGTYVDRMIETVVETLVQQMVVGGFNILDDAFNKAVQDMKKNFEAGLKPFQEALAQALQSRGTEDAVRILERRTRCPF